MFEHMTEQEARASILESISQYCEKFHMQKDRWAKGQRIPDGRGACEYETRHAGYVLGRGVPGADG